MTRSWLWIWIVPLLAPPAHAQEPEKPAPQGYEAVMQAQYAARQPPAPMRPEEAQKIYDTYLQSIGRPLKEQAAESQDNTTTPSH